MSINNRSVNIMKSNVSYNGPLSSENLNKNT
jgi:hypothetical protein